MIRKTEAIVLRTQKFSESSLLTTLYTQQSGIQSFIVKGYRSAKGKKRHSYFQPMSIIETVYLHKDSRELQMITESSSKYFFKKLQTEPVRITLGLVTVEVFQRSVKEHEQNIPLFNFLKETLIRFDEEENRLIHILIFFLLHLTKFLGFFPSDEEGKVSFSIPGTYNEPELLEGLQYRSSKEILRKFLKSSSDSCREISFSLEEKNEMIRMLLDYYKAHVDGFRDPESLKVFEEVFRYN